MKWAALILCFSTSMSWAQTTTHYTDAKSEIDDLTAALTEGYEPVMRGSRYQFELKSRQIRIKNFRQISLPEYVNNIFSVCNRLAERDAEINLSVRMDPITYANGPTPEQKEELKDIDRARSLCAAKGAYPENKRVKIYWVKYQNLDRFSLEEYGEVTSRLAQCFNIPRCRVGIIRHPG